MAQESQYQKYWLMLLKDGKLVIQVPKVLEATIRKAITARKYRYHQIIGQATGQKFKPLIVTSEPALDPKGKTIPSTIQLTFTLHNLRLKDL